MPYLGIAAAVAAGVALAPHVLWLALAIVVLVPIALLYRRVGAWALAGFVVVALFLWWAAWLASRGQWIDATFVSALLVMLIAREPIGRAMHRIWARFMAAGVDP